MKIFTKFKLFEPKNWHFFSTLQKIFLKYKIDSFLRYYFLFKFLNHLNANNFMKIIICFLIKVYLKSKSQEWFHFIQEKKNYKENKAQIKTSKNPLYYCIYFKLQIKSEENKITFFLWWGCKLKITNSHFFSSLFSLHIINLFLNKFFILQILFYVLNFCLKSNSNKKLKTIWCKTFVQL
jgi:hypothetical protein